MLTTPRTIIYGLVFPKIIVHALLTQCPPGMKTVGHKVRAILQTATGTVVFALTQAVHHAELNTPEWKETDTDRTALSITSSIFGFLEEKCTLIAIVGAGKWACVLTPLNTSMTLLSLIEVPPVKLFAPPGIALCAAMQSFTDIGMKSLEKSQE